MNKHNKRLINFKGSGELMKNVTIIMRFGLIMVISIGIFFYIGLYVDKWLGTKGIFTVILTIFGVIGGARTIYHQIMELTEKGKDENKQS